MLRNAIVLCGILLLALGLRVSLFVFVRSEPARAISPDSELYLKLGREFQQAYVNSDPAFLSDSLLRTPLYPLYCAACFAAAYDGILPVVIGQIGLSLLCIVITWGMAKALFNARVAGWAALLLALDPLTATYVNYVRNETLFTLLLVAAAFLWFQSLRYSGAAAPWFAGLILGLSVLARPVSTYLPLVIVPLGFCLKRGGIGARLVHAVVLIIGFAIPVGGWMARNYNLTGGLLISSIEGKDLLYFRAAGAIAEELGEKRWDVADRLEAALVDRYGHIDNPARLSAIQKSEAIRLLRKHPRGAIASVGRGITSFLLGPGQEALYRLVGVARENPQNATIRNWISGYQFAVLGIIYFAGLIGILVLCRHGAYGPLLGLLCLILYFTLVCAGPEAYSRYRVPVMPFFTILAGCGLGLRWSSHTSRKAGRPPFPQKTAGQRPQFQPPRPSAPRSTSPRKHPPKSS